MGKNSFVNIRELTAFAKMSVEEVAGCLKKAKGWLSPQEIGERTGLSVGTVSSNLRVLLKRGEAIMLKGSCLERGSQIGTFWKIKS